MKITQQQPLRAGLRLAARYWAALLIVYTVNLINGLALTIPPGTAVMMNVGHLPALRQAADGIDAWQVIDTMMSPLADNALGLSADASSLTSWLRQVTIIGLLTALAIPVIAWFTSTFLSGGVLSTFAASPRPFQLKRFIHTCWHWFGVFLLLGVVQTAVTLVFFAISAGLSAGLIALGGWQLAWVLVPLLVLLGLFLFAVFELTRVVAVTSGTRRISHAFRGATKLIGRRPLAISLLYGLTFLSLVILRAIYNQGIRPSLPLDWWPLVLVVQQTHILLRLWIRLARIAGAVTATDQVGSALEPDATRPTRTQWHALQ